MILYGKPVADYIYEKAAQNIKENEHTPILKIITVGDDPASKTYVRSKLAACEKVGITAEHIIYPESISEHELLQQIRKMSEETIDGIIVQLPLPKHINERKVLELINPALDVDGFTDKNLGRVMCEDLDHGYIPATPLGITEILDYYKIETAGKNAVIIGRSNIVGKPIANLLMSKKYNANVTVLHSKTEEEDLIRYCKNADIIILATGRPNLLTPDMITPGKPTIIDVGINRIPWENERGYKIVGDADYENLLPICKNITPVPGGVGVTTVASLIYNITKY